MLGRTNRAALVVCAAVGMMYAPIMNAAPLLLSDERELQVDVSVTDFGGSVDPPTVEAFPAADFALFDGFINYNNVQAPAGGARASASAEQLSSFDGSPEFTSLSATGQASGTGQTEDDGIQAISFALSEFEVDFRLERNYMFILTGTLREVGTGSLADVVISEVGGSALFTIDAAGPFSLMDTLPAGDYKLRARARATRTVGDSTIFSATASFTDMTFELIPEPTSLTLLMGCGVALLGSRRRELRRG